ncbi:hypothetical protein M3M33_15790, partial [Loigolactobacillus coryniformis]|uniref:hypothetical protein n=1 Tax=Loigolactobacillus coryniformis TaxID=1610 RepID=UPI00201AFF0A
YVEIVQGFQQKIFDENGYYANLETGNRIGVYVECYDCGKKINITPKAKLPKWVKSMINTLEKNNFSNSGSRL